jgi:hypothetical protein
VGTPDQKLVSDFLAKFEAAKAQRQPFEKEWYNNLAMYFGKHYMQWSGSTATGYSMTQPKAAAWRVRLVSNRIKTIVRKENSKVNKERGIWFVVPQTPDDEDLAKARMATAISDQLLDSKNYQLRKREAIWWRGICGTGFMKTYFDPSKDISYLAPSPFHIWVPNLEEQDIQEQEWVCHGIASTVEMVKAMYGVDVDADSNADIPESKFRLSLGLAKKGEVKDHVFLKEFWVKPCPQFPEGAMFVISNSQLIFMAEKPPEMQVDPATGKPVLDESGQQVPIPTDRKPSNILGGDNPVSIFPYEHGRYPFAKVDHIPTGRFYAESIIKDLIPIQKEYNRSRSQGIEARNLTGKPQWAVPKGSIDVRKLSAQPGLVIEYTPGFDAPVPVRNPELPAYFQVVEQASLNDMDYISNQYEGGQRPPPGVEAASAIAYLQEESDGILEETIASMEEMVQSIGYQSVMLAKQFWDEGKMVQVISGDQVYEVMQFKQNSLPDQVDFNVEHGSMAPRSRAAKQAFIIDLIDKQLIPPMEGLKYLEMSEVSRLYAELAIDTRQAERENFHMKQVQPATVAPPMDGMGTVTGQPPEPQPLQNPVMVNSFDNHQAHIYVHGKFMKSQSYEQLDPTVQQLFLAHYDQHLFTYGKQITDAGGTENGNTDSSGGAPTKSGQPA